MYCSFTDCKNKICSDCIAGEPSNDFNVCKQCYDKIIHEKKQKCFEESEFFKTKNHFEKLSNEKIDK